MDAFRIGAFRHRSYIIRLISRYVVRLAGMGVDEEFGLD